MLQAGQLMNEMEGSVVVWLLMAFPLTPDGCPNGQMILPCGIILELF